MSALEQLNSLVEKAARRDRWHRAWRGFWMGFLGGTVLWSLVLILYKVLPIPAVSLAYAAAAAALSCAIGFVAGGWQRTAPLQMARWLDSKEGLQERLSTTLEVAAQPRGAWNQMLLDDVAPLLARIEPKRLLPLTLPKAARGVALVLALAATAGFAPEYRSSAHQLRERERAAIRETGRQLAHLTRQSLKQREPSLETTQQTLEQITELGDQLSTTKAGRNEVLKELANLAERVKQQAAELARNPAFRKLDQAARQSPGSGMTHPGDLQKQIDALQNELGKATDAAPLEKMKQQLEAAQQTAAALANPSNAAQADALRSELAASLAALAEQGAELGLSLPDLQQAIEALQKSQVDQLLKDLDLASMDLEKLEALAKKLQQLKDQQGKMGKDLPEQLELGQADLAKATLEKMAQQLRAGSPDPAALEKMLDQLGRSVRAAQPYGGKLADLLKAGQKNLAAGQREAAAQDLEDAAQELQKILEEMGDCQNLMASLKALQHAQMCVGNCQSWGSPRLGLGKSGRGPGVGTWSDASDWLDPAAAEGGWDNSGVARPDMTPRGLADREADRTGEYDPTKVQGQFNPGAPMPGITLRGVSLKGVSKVQLKEMVTSAQSDAQSALSQDQVPRAYQGAVRDYFDDLKE